MMNSHLRKSKVTREFKAHLKALAEADQCRLCCSKHSQVDVQNFTCQLFFCTLLKKILLKVNFKMSAAALPLLLQCLILYSGLHNGKPECT